MSRWRGLLLHDYWIRCSSWSWRVRVITRDQSFIPGVFSILLLVFYILAYACDNPLHSPGHYFAYGFGSFSIDWKRLEHRPQKVHTYCHLTNSIADSFTTERAFLKMSSLHSETDSLDSDGLKKLELLATEIREPSLKLFKELSKHTMQTIAKWVGQGFKVYSSSCEEDCLLKFLFASTRRWRTVRIGNRCHRYECRFYDFLTYAKTFLSAEYLKRSQESPRMRARGGARKAKMDWTKNVSNWREFWCFWLKHYFFLIGFSVVWLFLIGFSQTLRRQNLVDCKLLLYSLISGPISSSPPLRKFSSSYASV